MIRPLFYVLLKHIKGQNRKNYLFRQNKGKEKAKDSGMALLIFIIL